MKLLYIIANSKKEEESSSRLVSRKLVDEIESNHPECEVEEINLYDDCIPRLEAKYFCGKNSLIEDCESLGKEDKENIQRIKELANQFAEADAYVIAAPLWSMSFPAPLKQYIDCIVLNGVTIELSEKECKGLLTDKDRKMVYVQASGAPANLLLKREVCQGIDYVEGIMETLGIKKFEKLLVDGTGYTEESKKEAEEKAMEKIPSVLRTFR